MKNVQKAPATSAREKSSAAPRQFSRREILKAGLGGMAVGATGLSFPAFAFPPEKPDEELVSFLDTPRTPPNRLDWETLDTWLTPQDQAFNVQHYGIPEFEVKNFKLEITGLVAKPMTLTMNELKALPKTDQLMTLECSGNGSSKGFMNAVYNSRWIGTPLAPLLEKCGIDPKAKEVVFLGMDRKSETLRPGTPRELTVEVPFGRSLSVEDAMNLPLLLAYDRNGEPLEKRNGAPLRLIVPGWYGVANVKWLTRIDVRDRRYMGRYMGRDYVTVRGERHGNEIVYLETSVARMNLKSVVARVTRRPTQNGAIPLKAYGAAWSDGTEIKAVEVKVDGGAWRPTILDAEPRAKFCWIFFSLDLGSVKPGKHVIVSRAIDVHGRIQPSADTDEIALKKTYWEAYEQWPREIEIEA
jgi:DMSO/TMAO reductase YedYZ molybdopterin-dependent catalytic subunit